MPESNMHIIKRYVTCFCNLLYISGFVRKSFLVKITNLVNFLIQSGIVD